MGMSDKQFNSYIRFLLDSVKEAKEKAEKENDYEKLDKVIENLQSTLESP